jgi:hypothetical protein
MFRATSAILSALALAATVWFVFVSLPNVEPLAPGIDTRTAHLATLKDRTIVDFGESADGTVAYSYLADAVPEKLADNEVPELRNETSYTKFIQVVKEGDDPTVKLESVIYSQPAYAKDVNGQWKYLEYATTTKEAFNHRTLTLWQRLTELLVRTAYADTYSPFSGAGDGYVLKASADPTEFCGGTWDTAHSATAGVKGDTGITMFAYVISNNVNFECESDIYRSFLPFDTSAIPSGASLSAATLSVYITTVNDQANDGFDYVTVVQTSQASHTALVNGDFDQCGAITNPTEGIDTGERKDLTSVTGGAYLTFTLNATGRGWVKKSGDSSNCSATAGITCLGVREGHDSTNTEITPDYAVDSITMSTSENTGTSQDPYLTVTYTVPSRIQGSVKLSPGGSLKVTGGGLKLQ